MGPVQAWNESVLPQLTYTTSGFTAAAGFIHQKQTISGYWLMTFCFYISRHVLMEEIGWEWHVIYRDWRMPC